MDLSKSSEKAAHSQGTIKSKYKWYVRHNYTFNADSRFRNTWKVTILPKRYRVPDKLMDNQTFREWDKTGEDFLGETVDGICKEVNEESQSVTELREEANEVYLDASVALETWEDARRRYGDGSFYTHDCGSDYREKSAIVGVMTQWLRSHCREMVESRLTEGIDKEEDMPEGSWTWMPPEKELCRV